MKISECFESTFFEEFAVSLKNVTEVAALISSEKATLKIILRTVEYVPDKSDLKIQDKTIKKNVL